MTAHPSIPDTLPANLLDEYADEVIAINTATGSELIHIAPADVGTLRITTRTGQVLWQLDNRGDPVSRADVALGMKLLGTERGWSKAQAGEHPLCSRPVGEVEPPAEHDSQPAAPSHPHPMLLMLAACGAVFMCAVLAYDALVRWVL